MKADRGAAERASDPDALPESDLAELKRFRKLTAQQAIDLEILRKAPAYQAVFRSGDQPVIGFRFVNDQQAEYRVTDLCRVAGVCRSGFYASRQERA